MKMTLNRMIFLLPLALAACAPGISRIGYAKPQEMQPADCKVSVAQEREVSVKETWKKLGSLKVYDKGMSVGCGEDNVMSIINSEACDLGADVFVIRSETRPDFLSSCYRVKGDFYKSGDSAVALKDPDRYSEDLVSKREHSDRMGQIVIGVIAGLASFVVTFILLGSK
jgi:hypothetical protein